MRQLIPHQISLSVCRFVCVRVTLHDCNHAKCNSSMLVQCTSQPLPNFTQTPFSNMRMHEALSTFYMYMYMSLVIVSQILQNNIIILKLHLFVRVCVCVCVCVSERVGGQEKPFDHDTKHFFSAKLIRH